jgi:hypothetical protein
MCATHMGMYCDQETNRSRDFDRFISVQPPLLLKSVFWHAACLYVYNIHIYTVYV